MTVKTIYVVENNKGEEVLRTEDKKYADWYDKRIDSGYNIASFISDNAPEELKKEITDDLVEELAIFLAKHPSKMSKLLKGKDLNSVMEEENMDEYKK